MEQRIHACSDMLQCGDMMWSRGYMGRIPSNVMQLFCCSIVVVVVVVVVV